jgi:hypothetical protein
MKTCSKCKETKNLDCFDNDKRSSDKKSSWCKQCSRRQKNVYRATSIGYEKAKTAVAQYRLTEIGRKKTIQATRNYQNNHPNGHCARLKNDFVYKAKIQIRSLIGNSIKKQGYSKTTKTAAILGCDYEFFHLYMEMQFKPGMSWDNHGEWHIDHKTPISWAKTEEEVIKLNHFTNLQPLWASENLSKGNRYAN